MPMMTGGTPSEAATKGAWRSNGAQRGAFGQAETAPRRLPTWQTLDDSGDAAAGRRSRAGAWLMMSAHGRWIAIERVAEIHAGRCCRDRSSTARAAAYRGRTAGSCWRPWRLDIGGRETAGTRQLGKALTDGALRGERRGTKKTMVDAAQMTRTRKAQTFRNQLEVHLGCSGTVKWRECARTRTPVSGLCLLRAGTAAAR